MNSKVQLNMVTWQTDRGTLSFLSERGNFGTWELSSASDCASDYASYCASACASASSTQSRISYLPLTLRFNLDWIRISLRPSRHKSRPSLHTSVQSPHSPHDPPSIQPLLQCLASIKDDGPTFKQHWVTRDCFIVGPLHMTSAQHYSTIESMSHGGTSISGPDPHRP